MTTVWITKYALTRGIAERELIDLNDTYVQVKEGGNLNGWALYHGHDWHLDRDKAIARAEQMREERIASLKKQIQRLDKLSFREGQ